MPNANPDLTKQAPRSARVRLGGYVTLPRMLDKGRATLAGKNGEYHYACPMDQRLLDFLGLDAEVLKKQWPNLKVFAVEPTLSPVISGGQPGPHPIQGIGAGFIPANLHTDAIDGTIQVDPNDAKEYARRAAREEGLLVGISSGATLAAIAQKLKELPAGVRVLGFNYDTGERYLSVPDFLPEQ